LSLQFEEQNDMNHYEVLEKVRKVIKKAKGQGIEFKNAGPTIWMKSGALLSF